MNLRPPRPRPSRTVTAPLFAAPRSAATHARFHHVALTRSCRPLTSRPPTVPLTPRAPHGRCPRVPPPPRVDARFAAEAVAFLPRDALHIPVGRVPCAPSPRRSPRCGRRVGVHILNTPCACARTSPGAPPAPASATPSASSRRGTFFGFATRWCAPCGGSRSRPSTARWPPRAASSPAAGSGHSTSRRSQCWPSMCPNPLRRSHFRRISASACAPSTPATRCRRDPSWSPAAVRHRADPERARRRSPRHSAAPGERAGGRRGSRRWRRAIRPR